MVLDKVYEAYSDRRGRMDFEQFLKFASDFSIFPDIISKAHLHRIFQNIAFSSE